MEARDFTKYRCVPAVRAKCTLILRVDLPVPLGLRKKFKSCQKMRKICADIFSDAPPKYCARIVPDKFCTISAHFLMPPHMFRTNFQGPLGTTPRTNFAQFSQTRGMFFKSASVQANNVSTLISEPRLFTPCDMRLSLSGLPRVQILHNFLRHVASFLNLPLYRQIMSQH